MFVLADIEWITHINENEYPTQLSAVKVDENWKDTDSFSEFIRTKDGETPNISHMAYTGGTAEEFQNADSLSDVFTAFENWLSEDDIIVWWHYESLKVFKKFCKHVFGRKSKNKSIVANIHVYAFLAGQEASQGNIYKMAAARGVDTQRYRPHFSPDDVRVMRELMMVIGYPQPELLKPPPVTEKSESEKLKKHINIATNLMYQYDPNTNVIHIKDCKKLLEKRIVTHGYEHLITAVRKGYKPCGCCREEYNNLRRERNAFVLGNTPYAYAHVKGSGVFHKTECKRLISAKEIMYAWSYKELADTGKKPCKICNPQPQDERKKRQARKGNTYEKKPKYKGEYATNEERKAIKRQIAAIKERDSKLKKANLSEIEKHDIYTLTQPGYAFWVGRGYKNFHLRSCRKLQGISNLKGFGTYNDAVHSGYTPCRHCKPTSKHDVKYSIPITSRKRIGDTVEKLEEMCRTEGYKYIINEGRFCLETDVGKWRILLNTSPVKLEHINFVRTPNEKNYHEQPRLFLSLADTFSYIKRHDEELLKQKQKGMVYLKLIREGVEYL